MSTAFHRRKRSSAARRHGGDVSYLSLKAIFAPRTIPDGKKVGQLITTQGIHIQQIWWGETSQILSQLKYLVLLCQGLGLVIRQGGWLLIALAKVPNSMLPYERRTRDSPGFHASLALKPQLDGDGWMVYNSEYWCLKISYERNAQCQDGCTQPDTYIMWHMLHAASRAVFPLEPSAASYWSQDRVHPDLLGFTAVCKHRVWQFQLRLCISCRILYLHAVRTADRTKY